MFPRIRNNNSYLNLLGSNMYLVVCSETMHELRLFLNNFRKTGKTAHVFPAKTSEGVWNQKVCIDRDIDVWETVQDMA
jgi:hypothetical protein